MSPSPFFSNRITKARTICYIVLLVLQVVLLGLVADYTVWVQVSLPLDNSLPEALATCTDILLWTVILAWP